MNDSTTNQLVKSWYADINNTLQQNNVSNTNKRISCSNSIQTSSSSSSSISILLKRFGKSYPILKSSNSNTSSSWLSLKKKGQQQAGGDEGVKIYMKSPHVVANGELAGTLVIHLNHISNLDELELSFIGIEAVIDPQSNHVLHQYQFLNLQLFILKSQKEIQSFLNTKENTISIPFVITLDPQLGGTYKDKKGSIQYYLQSDIKSKTNPILSVKKSILVYPNVTSLKSLKDAIDLYLPIIENNKQVWKSLTSSVVMDLSLSRIVWMSGAPIYVTAKIHNSTVYTICDMKLELLRKQNTYSVTREVIIPLTACCEIISQTSLAALDWWQPLEPDTKDYVTMTVEAPPNQVTIRNQKLIDISFSIRIWISSPQRSDVIAEIPVMLVHPITLDPPPLFITKKSSIASNLMVSNPNIKKSLAKTLPDESSLFVPSLTSILNSTKPLSMSSISSQQQPSSPTATKIMDSNKLEKMKKSISNWGTILSRKLSMNRISDSQSNTNTKMTRPEISSPILSSHSNKNDSVASSIGSSPSLLTNSRSRDISGIIYRDEQRSVMKYGHIKAPKRFGQQPGSLGDAGLDIRNCFNVATATEAIQSYAAEKVEIPDDIGFYSSSSEDESDEEIAVIPITKNYKDNFSPYLEPIQVLENCFELKKGVIAPHEKCEVDKSMIKNEPLKKVNSSKRVLASSRHYLLQGQRKQTQLPPSSVL